MRTIMNIIYSIFAVITLACSAFAQQAAPDSVSFRVITTFDYPRTGVIATAPQKINDGRDIVGEYGGSNGITRGFVRFANGTFSAPIVEPNDTGGYTAGRGINNSRLICGEYLGSDSTLHGYFLSGHTYSEYDVVGFAYTSILGISNIGDFAGAVSDATGNGPAFVSIGGNITTFSVPGAISTAAYQLNFSEQTEGYYIDSSGLGHGFWRDTDGTLHLVDVSGALETFLFGNNDSNWMVGRYDDSAGITHGLFFVPPNKFFPFDYPGSTFTSFNGINAQGYICGRYIDASGIDHGIIVRVKIGAATSAADTEIKALDSSSPVIPVIWPSLVRPVNTFRPLW